MLIFIVEISLLLIILRISIKGKCIDSNDALAGIIPKEHTSVVVVVVVMVIATAAAAICVIHLCTCSFRLRSVNASRVSIVIIIRFS